MAIDKLTTYYNQGDELWISRQVIREYFSAMTKERNLTQPSVRTAVLNEIRSFIAQFQVADETAQVTEKLLLLLDQIPVRRRQVYDCNIVATMQAYNITHLLTNNVKDFAGFSDFITVISLEDNP